MTTFAIINMGPKRIFTILQRSFTPGRKPDPNDMAFTIEVGKHLEITLDNGEPICVVELEN